MMNKRGQKFGLVSVFVVESIIKINEIAMQEVDGTKGKQRETRIKTTHPWRP